MFLYFVFHDLRISNNISKNQVPILHVGSCLKYGSGSKADFRERTTQTLMPNEEAFNSHSDVNDELCIKPKENNRISTFSNNIEFAESENNHVSNKNRGN